MTAFEKVSCAFTLFMLVIIAAWIAGEATGHMKVSFDIRIHSNRMITDNEMDQIKTVADNLPLKGSR